MIPELMLLLLLLLSGLVAFALLEGRRPARPVDPRWLLHNRTRSLRVRRYTRAELRAKQEELRAAIRFDPARRWS